MRPHGAFLFLSAAFPGCIGDERPVADSAIADSGSLPDGLDRFDTREVSDAADGAAEVEVGPVACTNEGGSCDDGDVCTGSGTCLAGVCQPGVALACDEGMACGHSRCDPGLGCVVDVIAAGFCEAPAGTPWGTCDGARMAPLDRCDEDGACVDSVTQLNTPLPRDQVFGDWYLIATSTGSGGYLETLSGLATFAPTGLWEGLFTGMNGLQAFDGADVARGWCVDASGGLAFDFGENHYVGQVDPRGETLAARGEGPSDLVVALRSTGDLIAADGSYAALLSRRGQAGTMVTWFGSITLTLGCVDVGATLYAGTQDEPIVIRGDGACFAPPLESVVAIELPTELAGGGIGPWFLSGAIGPSGDVMLLRTGTTNPLRGEFGMLLLVRRHGQAGTHFAGQSRWGLALQEIGAVDFRSVHRTLRGALLLDRRAVLNGVLGADAVIGGALAHDDFGRFLMSLRTTSARRTLSGYLAADGGLGFFYEIESPAEWDTLIDVTEVPRWPSLGILVERAGP